MTVNFYSGLEANLPTTGTAGSFYVTTDTGKLFLFVSNSERIQLNAEWVLQQIANVRAYIVSDTEPPIAGNEGKFWIYSKDNIIKLYYNTGSGWALIPGVWG